MGRTACTEPQCLYRVTFTFYNSVPVGSCAEGSDVVSFGYQSSGQVVLGLLDSVDEDNAICRYVGNPRHMPEDLSLHSTPVLHSAAKQQTINKIFLRIP